MKITKDSTEGARRLVRQRGGMFKEDDEGYRLMITLWPENDYDKAMLLALGEAVWHPLENLETDEGAPCYCLCFDVAREQDIEVVE